MRPTLIFGVLIFCSCVFIQQDANAYLDPSSGSILIQIILGGVAGFAVLLRIYWRKIRRYLGLYKDGAEEEVSSQDANDDQS